MSEAFHIIDSLNKRYPVGTVVDVEKDNGSLFRSKVKDPFTVLPSGTPVGWFEGISGCYLATRVREVAA